MMKWADADMDYPRCWMGKDRDLPPEATLKAKGQLNELVWLRPGRGPSAPADP
jgi:hypothetical protein